MRTRAIHAKIANRRRNFLHQHSAKLVQQYGVIAVGDVSAANLAQTTMAKSVLDAGWSDFRTMLRYKARLRGGGVCVEVSERFTTQTCSGCGRIAGPRGRAGLNERMWQCDGCGAMHDRDVNAARNILRLGQQTLAGGAHG
jgi:IS605 OrfB family transposase